MDGTCHFAIRDVVCLVSVSMRAECSSPSMLRLQPLVEQSAGPGPGIRWRVGVPVQWLESLR